MARSAVTAAGLRRRLLFLHAALGAPWPDVSDEALLDTVEQWLGPDLARVRSTADLRRIDTTAALRRLLPWPQAGELDRLAPERIEVPSGSKVAVDYTDPQRPVLAVRLQEVFGWDQAPRLAGGPDDGDAHHTDQARLPARSRRVNHPGEPPHLVTKFPHRVG